MVKILPKDLSAKLLTKLDRRLFSGLEYFARMGAVKPRVKAIADSEELSRTEGVKAEVLSSTEAFEEEASSTEDIKIEILSRTKDVKTDLFSSTGAVEEETSSTEAAEEELSNAKDVKVDSEAL